MRNMNSYHLLLFCVIYLTNKHNIIRRIIFHINYFDLHN